MKNNKKYSIYWYNVKYSPIKQQICDAFLYNCRDNDLRYTDGIPLGAIVAGAVGYVIAERPIYGIIGTIVPFKQNRLCKWNGFELACMVHPMAPKVKFTKKELRFFNYIVAELTDPDAIKVATNLELAIVSANRRRFINLEIGRFERQGKHSIRRAQLLPQKKGHL